MKREGTIPPGRNEEFPVREFYRLPDSQRDQVQAVQMLLGAFPSRDSGFVRGWLELPPSVTTIFPVHEVCVYIQGAGGNLMFSPIRRRADETAPTAPTVRVLLNPFLLPRRLEFSHVRLGTSLEDQAEVRQAVARYVEMGYLGTVHVEQRSREKSVTGTVWFQFCLREGEYSYVALKARTKEAAAPFQGVLSIFLMQPEDLPEDLKKIFD